jgi:hypothetical protein
MFFKYFRDKNPDGCKHQADKKWLSHRKNFSTMAMRKHPSKKQLAVIDDLFAGELDKQAVLDKHGVGRNIYNKWLTDETFQAEFARRISGAHLAGEALIARYCLVAAAKLVQLTVRKTKKPPAKHVSILYLCPKFQPKAKSKTRSKKTMKNNLSSFQPKQRAES